MMDLYSKFEELCGEFENSIIIKDYTAAKEELCANKEALSKIREFKRLHIQLNNLEKEGKRDLGLERHVSSMYFSLLRADETAGFLRAENRLVKHLKFFYSGLDELLKRCGINGFGSDDI